MIHWMGAIRTIVIVFTLIALQTSCRPTNPIGPAPASQPAASARPAIVKIDNFEFKPRELTVPVGTTVVWQNADDVPHTATSKGKPQVFDSGPLDTDGQFSFTFTRPGIYAYYCKVHPHMSGTVQVK